MKTNRQATPLFFRIPVNLLQAGKHFPISIFLIFTTFCYQLAEAQVSHALIIGIDIYKPANDPAQNPSRSIWRNLGGCVNDAGAMRDLIISRYQFPEENISSLFNQEASRERIIAGIRHLITVSKKGDVVFIYYAGHGSQMKNSLSREADKKDETIVPADAYKGAKDIRDKELAVLFNELVDKGVVLTVIFDSCHSGSAGRGTLYQVNGVRNLDADPNDAADPSDPPRPEERGALIISAAQDFEFAKELEDENKIMHGAFTLALLKSLQQNDADAPVESIFSGVQAILKYYGKTQEPVLAGNEVRKKSGLFGTVQKKNTLTRIPVLKTAGEKVELMGGYAFGLAVGQMLRSIHNQDTLLVTEMIGANRSLAQKISTSQNKILPGALFEVINWTSSAAASLKIYIPTQVADQKILNESITAMRTARKTRASSFVNDVTGSFPSTFIHYGKNAWWFVDGNGNMVEENSLGKILTKSKGSVFVNLPPEKKFAADLNEYFSKYNSIEIVSDPGDALYSLIGRLNENNRPEYAFVRNHITGADSLEILPVRTDFHPYDLSKQDQGAMVEKLAEHAFKIARIRNWMMLQPPEGANRFPYALEVKQYRSGETVNGIVQLRDTLSFFISKTPSEEKWNRRKRYVYVFSIDAGGAMKLMFPSASRGNVENRFPATDAINNTETQTRLFDMLVKPPLGNDVYFMLSTEEAISNLSAFQQSGVVSRGPGQPISSIESLLYTGAKSRNKISTPLTWSIQKIVLHIHNGNK